MKGSTAVFQSRCSTPEEIDSCLKIFLSDLEYWDPVNVVFNASTVESENITTIISEYDIAMQIISIGHQPETMYKNMINSTNVKLPPIAVSVKS